MSMVLAGTAIVGWAAYKTGLVRETLREWFLASLMFGAWLAMASTCKQDPEALPLIGILPLGLIVVTAALARETCRRLDMRLAIPAMMIALLLMTHDAKNSALSWVFSRMTIKTLEPAVERYPDAGYEASQLITSKRVDPKLFDMLSKEWVESTFAALPLLKEILGGAGRRPFCSDDSQCDHHDDRVEIHPRRLPLGALLRQGGNNDFAPAGRQLFERH